MTKQFALLGCPLGHSISPTLHSALFRLSGHPGAYRLWEITPQALPSPQTRTELLALDGFNVTIPHKQAIIPLLDALDESAQTFGAVNTAVVSGGQITGYNTDGAGFLRAVDGVPLDGDVCVLGAGGAAAVFAFCCAKAGARVTLAVRPGGESRAQALAARMMAVGLPAPIITLVDTLQTTPFDLLINATPCGMHPHTEAMPVHPRLLRHVDVLFDCVYNPLQTHLMAQAQEAGCQVIGGLDMLLWQAAAAHTIWYGAQFTPAQMEQVKREMTALLAAGRERP